jgi:hypothetical protein
VAKTFAAIIMQPKAFTFYEEGTETPVPLTFGSGGSSTMTYQWYKITGGNIHVRIAQKCVEVTDGTGVTSTNFTPKVIKGTTRNANNTGFYRYYCVAKNLTGDSVISNIAEVAVGCGAKNKDGEWLSFMCFNLGADKTQFTIAAQRNTALNIGTNASDGIHTYVTNEEQKYGDLYQWGRIRDGHEKRGTSAGFVNGSNAAGTNQVAANATTITFESGNIIGTSQRYPYIQIDRNNSTYYGKFITSASQQDHDWAKFAIGQTGNNLPAAVTQGTLDLLWRNGRFASNDPCTKIKEDGITYETFYPVTDGISGSSTAWKTPSQGEWGEIYRGGELSGSPNNAIANTWTWYGSNGRGFDIKPDGTTITLHLPASGARYSSGRLYYQGTSSFYWSTTYTSVNAYNLNFGSGTVLPANISYRGYGFAVRCIRSM